MAPISQDPLGHSLAAKENPSSSLESAFDSQGPGSSISPPVFSLRADPAPGMESEEAAAEASVLSGEAGGFASSGEDNYRTGLELNSQLDITDVMQRQQGIGAGQSTFGGRGEKPHLYGSAGAVSRAPLQLADNGKNKMKVEASDEKEESKEISNFSDLEERHLRMKGSSTSSDEKGSSASQSKLPKAVAAALQRAKNDVSKCQLALNLLVDHLKTMDLCDCWPLIKVVFNKDLDWYGGSESRGKFIEIEIGPKAFEKGPAVVYSTMRHELIHAAQLMMAPDEEHPENDKFIYFSAQVDEKSWGNSKAAEKDYAAIQLDLREIETHAWELLNVKTTNVPPAYVYETLQWINDPYILNLRSKLKKLKGNTPARVKRVAYWKGYLLKTAESLGMVLDFFNDNPSLLEPFTKEQKVNTKDVLKNMAQLVGNIRTLTKVKAQKDEKESKSQSSSSSRTSRGKAPSKAKINRAKRKNRSHPYNG